MSENNIKCIIRPVHEGSLLAKPPLMVNGKHYPYEYGKETTLPEFVVNHAERSGGLRIERLGKAKAETKTTEPESPADTLGNGDGAADGPGGADGGADSGEAAAEDQHPDPLDHDGDGEPGGSLPHDPPALTGKTKDELIQIAEDESADLSEAKNNPDRIAAIEANREAKG
jgi:hypothetical protein